MLVTITTGRKNKNLFVTKCSHLTAVSACVMKPAHFSRSSSCSIAIVFCSLMERYRYLLHQTRPVAAPLRENVTIQLLKQEPQSL